MREVTSFLDNLEAARGLGRLRRLPAFTQFLNLF